ncbi:multidrug transporter [Microbacterium sp. p3-SID336]|uniref:multidrug transporter n=1 Tax=Microbacterium sp. p3-SID336 TaxID=2916212 RepID=UPI0021A603A8|nr:multidrug transporter [Microbacterium sp. p3-SID336]MCT1479347.1 multidrug transporter [Microbacterium sp. p3-SID336]
MSTPDRSEHDEDFEKNRRDQLTSAPEATEADAAPRIDVSEHDGTTRVDIRDDAEVRPGPGPGMPEADGAA